jgi:hypothetical protein
MTILFSQVQDTQHTVPVDVAVGLDVVVAVAVDVAVAVGLDVVVAVALDVSFSSKRFLSKTPSMCMFRCLMDCFTFFHRAPFTLNAKLRFFKDGDRP